ncbi:lipopolysaccharide heptosyltransferase II [bacterium]|nr:lipopolysaccharide heptosyltransferase II [bacterium]
MVRILIVQTAFAGDLILTSPLIHCTKEIFPQSEVSLLTTPIGEEIFKNNPYLDNIIVFDKRNADKGIRAIFKISKKLKQMDFKYCLLPHNSFKSGLICYLAKIKYRIGFKGTQGTMFYTRKVKQDKKKIIIERILDLLGAFQERICPIAPEIFTDSDDSKAVDDFFIKYNINEERDRLIGISLGSHWATKRYPESKIVKLIEIILHDTDYKIILIGSKDEYEMCESIRHKFYIRVYNAAGIGSIRTSAELIKRLRLLVSNDSTPGHIGSAVRTPVVTIYGPTIPEFGFRPYGRDNRVVQVALDCRPCNPHGPQKCPKKHHNCMNLIQPEMIYKEINSILQL